jgi:hypothetical protein
VGRRRRLLQWLIDDVAIYPNSLTADQVYLADTQKKKRLVKVIGELVHESLMAKRV